MKSHYLPPDTTYRNCMQLWRMLNNNIPHFQLARVWVPWGAISNRFLPHLPSLQRFVLRFGAHSRKRENERLTGWMEKQASKRAQAAPLALFLPTFTQPEPIRRAAMPMENFGKVDRGRGCRIFHPQNFAFTALSLHVFAFLHVRSTTNKFSLFSPR